MIIMEINLEKLSDVEKLNLINIIWASIEDKDNSLPVDDAHIQILMERTKTVGKTISWETASEKIKDLFK